MKTTNKTSRTKSYMAIAAMFMIAAIRNIITGINSNMKYLSYFSPNKIWLTPGLRLVCFVSGIFFLIAAICMVAFAIHEKIQENKANSICRMTDDEWNQFCSLGKVDSELAKKVEEADEISMSELEHLSDKKD